MKDNNGCRDKPSPKQTPLQRLHNHHRARMVDFVGWLLPIQYPSGIITEHLSCRSGVGLFDISHMGQLSLPAISGTDLEALLPLDASALSLNRTRYSLLLDENGGILDDLMITAIDDGYRMVVNAARTEHDIAWFNERLPSSINVVHHSDRVMLALQGPRAEEVLVRLFPEIARMVFMDYRSLTFNGEEVWITRSGYTGEDGFEVSLPSTVAEALVDRLIADGTVTLCGLGSRDSLRLEAGLALWGHDIDGTTTPVAAGLGFAIAPTRRESGGYPGANVVNPEFTDGIEQCRVGLVGEGRQPVREGAPLIAEGTVVGRVTSGGVSPSTKKPIAMGYLATRLAQPGQRVEAEVRGKRVVMVVTTLPFIPRRYKRS